MFAALVIGALTAAVVSGCSQGSGFPRVLDSPAPRADTPLSPVQVQQATDDLISDRDRLSAEMHGGAKADALPLVTGSTKLSAKKRKSAGSRAPDNGTLAAGADTKP
jgi:hypothetical protein